MVIELTKKRVVNAVVGLTLWILSVMMEDKVKEIFQPIKQKIMSSYFWVVTGIFIIGMFILFAYWFLQDLLKKVDNINRRVKMLSAIFFQLRNTGQNVFPTREALLEAGVTIEDLIYFGYTDEQIRGVFP